MKEKNVLTVDLDWIQNQRQGLELIKFLKPILENTETIFIRGHQQAYDYVFEGCHLYNIDHHHDIGYGHNGKVYDDAIIEGKFSEGEWVLSTIVFKKLKSYTWIKNYDSTFIIQNVTKPLRALPVLRMYDELDSLKKIMPKFDRVIICESVNYSALTPFYYELFKIFCKNKFEVENDNFLSYRQVLVERKP